MDKRRIATVYLKNTSPISPGESGWTESDGVDDNEKLQTVLMDGPPCAELHFPDLLRRASPRSGHSSSCQLDRFVK